MASLKTFESKTLSIEVENGVDKDGNPKYRKKNFSNIKEEAVLDNIYAVAEAISPLLNANTGNYFINETSLIQ